MEKGFVILVAALLILSSCPSPDGNGPNGALSGTISGTVTDSRTGDPISGATVMFGDYSTTTDASGDFSITVGSKDILSKADSLGFYAAFKDLGYSFVVVDGISIDPSANPVYNIRLEPFDDSGYSSINLSGKIYDSSATEIDDDSHGWFEIVNEKGGFSGAEVVGYDKTGRTGYNTTTPAIGSDCFLLVYLEDVSDNPLFAFYKTGQDLSADKTNYDHTEPSNYKSVTLNGTDGTMFRGHLAVPGSGYTDYRYIESYIDGEFIGSSQTTIEIHNPEDYPIQWWTLSMQVILPAGDEIMKINAKNIAFSNTIDLPSRSQKLGLPTLWMEPL